jgi:phage N-6-adenine-methyltransferase
MVEQGPGCDEYETPPWLFKALDSEFGLNLDVAAKENNKLCARYIGDVTHESVNITYEDRVFCNPPYSAIQFFVTFALQTRALWVMLLPVRADSDWFRALIESQRCEFRYFRKRIRFYLGGKEIAAPRFASMVVIVRPK